MATWRGPDTHYLPASVATAVGLNAHALRAIASFFMFSVLLHEIAAADVPLSSRSINTSVLDDPEFAARLREISIRHSMGTHLAVVIPTCTTQCPADVDRLEASLRRWQESQYAPCPKARTRGLSSDLTQPDDDLPSQDECETKMSSSPSSFHAHLLVYMDQYSVETEHRVKSSLHIHDTAMASAMVCFQNLAFLSAQLASSDNTYPRAPNLMFFKFAIHVTRAKAFDYFFIMEADVTPLRPYWLTMMSAFLPPQASRFWVKGSTSRGTTACLDCRHINGNALYTAKDSKFGEFLEKVFRAQARYEEMKHSRHIGYDRAIHYSMLLKSDRASSQYRHEVSHLYVYSDFIIDHYSVISQQSARKLYPCSLLLHANRSSKMADLEHRPLGPKRGRLPSNTPS